MVTARATLLLPVLVVLALQPARKGLKYAEVLSRAEVSANLACCLAHLP
jgi:hypothetical protein